MPIPIGPALKRALGPEIPTDARPVVVLGVGSPLRGDDAAGLHVAAALARDPLPGVVAIEAGPAPENLTHEIRRLRPATVVIVDCASMGARAGSLGLLAVEQIDGVSVGTHGLPLSVLAGYLQKETGCSVVVLGIEPDRLEPEEGLSEAVRSGVAEAVALLREVLSGPSQISLDAGESPRLS
jgi:hydrogenase 3 maturation protease